MDDETRPTATPDPRPRRRAAVVLVAGLLAIALAGFVAPELAPVHGQTGPRRPTPPVGPSTPLATVPVGVPTVAATVEIARPVGGSAPGGVAATSPSTTTGGPSGPAVAPSLAAPAPPQPTAPANSPSVPNAGAPAGLPQPLVVDDSPGAPPVAVPTSVVGPPPSAPQPGPFLSAIVPAAADPSASGLAVVSSAGGAAVRVTVFAPPRPDGPVRLTVGAPDPSVLAAISLPGAVVARAFTVDASRPDGAPISTHPRPLTLVVGYTDGDLGFAAGDPRRLHVLRWDPDRQVALVLDTKVDAEARTLSAQTDHTSLFLIAGLAPSAPREIGARARAPWGAEPAPTAPVPAAMPKVGGTDAGPSLFDRGLPVLVLGGSFLATAVAAASVGRRGLVGTAGRRLRRRYVLLAALLLASCGLLDPTVRLVAGTVLRLPQLAVTLGGFGAARTFLVISQSTDEPRPTGGFMGSMGLLSTHNGRVETFDYRNSLEFEDSRAPSVRPPAPLERYAGLGGWIMRDANWSPDFPTTMEQVDWFWQRDQGARLDGAVAVDEDALSVLLTATGPVTVPETGEEVGTDDLRRWIAFQLYPLGRDGRPTYESSAKTRVLSALGQAVLRRLLSPRLQDLRPYAAAVGRVVREKHLLVWFRDPGLQDLARGWGADGTIRAAPGDYLAVVDASVTLNKVGRYVVSRVDYVAEPRPAEALTRARATLTYENRYDAVEARRYYPPLYLGQLYNPRADRFDNVEGLWATYVRVFAPAGAVLRGASGLDETPTVETDLGKSVFGAYLTVGVGERRRVTFEYDLPQRDPAGSYSLLLQRQPGVLRTYSVALETAGRRATLFEGPLTEDRGLTARTAP